MSDASVRMAFVVATKDRPREIDLLLRNLEAQTRRPDEVVVVDGGREPVASICSGIAGFPVRYIRVLPPSAARQRNAGLDAVERDTHYAGFFDDDIVLEKSALERMSRFWREADQRIGGASFNMLNHPVPDWPMLKLSPLAEALGVYSRRRGTVTAAGFQTMIGISRRTVFTDWLPSGACVWRREVFERFRFDEWYEGYSYLEDLDFSYRVGKTYRLAVVADAGYYHFPAAAGRGNGFEFGMREVLNRVHFVLKNPELSLPRCYLALAARTLMTLGAAARDGHPLHDLRRSWGNAVGLARSLGRI
jgi:GT2 family glycosyltransferase